MAVTKYSRKPEVVDALQYIGTNWQEVLNFAPGVTTYVDGILYLVEGGGQVVQSGWWVLKDFAGMYSTFATNFLDYYKPGGGP